ncbi:Aminobenzoyl-glutamate transport protein [Indibacter alkaliphilus LW1]|uniref:Aminobenzoyl-glutamate transport protein n=1 Tax=Indibacter alkaliphilus (strain CCUG 57479 / KCTC 22604 / LW1) TaxID=1189612 RepID=S2D9Q6_INDAL|nr:AbgT family transporter [Indibacter alkaliphilus]EOZ93720.1 Aminobenzoyl-glutamate transport protein [Indibacter alkaliphilus LW1]
MSETTSTKKSFLDRFLDFIEKAGNKLPDPAMLFLMLMLLTWIMSAILSPIDFGAIDPRSGAELRVQNLLTGTQFANFLANMTGVFINFPPLGVVLLAMLGVGVAEHSGFINAGLKFLLGITPKMLLTPILTLVAIVSHTAADAGYVLVIPLGGVIFYAAGRHPLAGIAAAFAGVSGGFSANFIPSSIDPLIQSFTQSAAQILDSDITLNPLNNIFFTGLSSIVVVGVVWFLTDRVIEPRLNKNVTVDENLEDIPKMETLNTREKKAFWLAFVTMFFCMILLVLWAIPNDSALRDSDGEITSIGAPLMKSIVPLIFVLFWIPGVVYGFLSGTYKSAQDMVQSMSKAMGSMAYYIVMAFFCALFIDAFGKSNIGALTALKGADILKAMELPAQITIVGIVVLTAFVNLLVGSASAKWALISPIFVPMLMQLEISPDLTQAAYRVGDSVSNIITPLLPYFPLIVVFCQRYVKSTGIGTLVSIMLPYSLVLLVIWTLFLLLYWTLGIPLGLQSTYEYYMNFPQ